MAEDVKLSKSLNDLKTSKVVCDAKDILLIDLSSNEIYIYFFVVSAAFWRSNSLFLDAPILLGKKEKKRQRTFSGLGGKITFFHIFQIIFYIFKQD